MEFEKDRKNDSKKLAQLANTLVEMLPWVKAATGKTIVIKYGGAAMVDKSLRAEVMSDILMLKIMGLNPVLVHGGGADINNMLKRLNIEPKFVDGLRVTDEATMEIVKEVLIGKVNTELVAAMNQHGNIAVGLSGVDGHTIVASSCDEIHGCTGHIDYVNADYIRNLMDQDYIPVIASIATSEDSKTFFNINADEAAGEIAAAIGAHKVVFLSDVDGLYKDFDDKTSLISRLTLNEAKDLAESGRLSKGMIPKIDAVVKALSEGVPRAHLLNGAVPHSLLLEFFTDKGVGTMVTPGSNTDVNPNFEIHPLADFAAKLQD